MCGIFGYLTKNEEALGPILIAAAERLTYRGYDSVGAATLNSGKIDLRKDVGKVDSVAAKYNIAECADSAGLHSCVGRRLANHHKLIHSRIWIRTGTWLARTMVTW